ncbi:MAG: hypothetical protein ACYCSI_09000 [Solirubrobacteraceae bacterium]
MLAIGSATLLLIVLLVELGLPKAWRGIRVRRRERLARESIDRYDPGRELRAEQKARELLRSCLNAEEWEMYRDLGFLRLWGSLTARPSPRGLLRGALERAPEADYAYLIYPHRPIVAYLPQTGALLNEYCVSFPDRSRPYGSERLPASDDVLAKWMALRADERQLICEANMHLPGRQVDPEMVRRDIRRLSCWERERLRRSRGSDAEADGGGQPPADDQQREQRQQS